MAWIFNPNDYQEKDYSPVPAGDHRVRITDVVYKRFNSGNNGYEITLEVSGYNSKLWFYLVLKEDDAKKTNQNIGDFFNSFGITDPNCDHYHGWVGKVGAVKVKHEKYNGQDQAKAAFCISRKNQDKLPPANFSSAVPAENNSFGRVEINDDDLPFA